MTGACLRGGGALGARPVGGPGGGAVPYSATSDVSPLSDSRGGAAGAPGARPAGGGGAAE